MFQLSIFDISNWVHSTQGMIHFVASVIGLFTAAYILIAKKGTLLHKRMGYVFSVSLVIVNITAMFIYDFNDVRLDPFIISFLYLCSFSFLVGCLC